MNASPKLIVFGMTVAFFYGAPGSARIVEVEGIGVSIRPADKRYRYKSDHMDTGDFSGGLIFPKSKVPKEVKGLSFATHDFRNSDWDSRTNDEISRVRASASGDLLIAMPSSAAAGDGWKRLSSGSDADFHLDNADRRGKFTPNRDYPYWFYTRSYLKPGSWVDLPVNSVPNGPEGKRLPPFVFSKKVPPKPGKQAVDDLRWANPPKLMNTVSTIAHLPYNTGYSNVVNPCVIVLSNGYYLASASNGEREDSGASGAAVYLSTDKGLTWRTLVNGLDINRQSLFELGRSIYIIGESRSNRKEMLIFQSSNGGRTWKKGMIPKQLAGGEGKHGAPSHVDILNGRIWLAMMTKVAGANDLAPGFMSAPVDANLLDGKNWTYAGPSVEKGNRFGLTRGVHNYGYGNKVRVGDEGTLLRTEDNRLINAVEGSVQRPGESELENGIPLVFADLSDPTKTTFDPDYSGPRLEGLHAKYTVRFDPVSDHYWAITSGPGSATRNVLNLYSASSEGNGEKISDFRFRATVLEGHSRRGYHGFNYPFMQFDGDDIIFVSRTAFDSTRGTAARWHDANQFTFHRVKDFRELLNSVPNHIANGGFEDMMAGWETSGMASAGRISSLEAHAGKYALKHESKEPYQVRTHRLLTGLNDGKYTLRAWVKSSGGQSTCRISISDEGGSHQSVDIERSDSYKQVEIRGITVNGGECRIAFESSAESGEWLCVDDVEFFQDSDESASPP